MEDIKTNTNMKKLDVKDDHNFSENPVFIRKSGKLIGMIRRSDFNNLYPVSTDRIKEFEMIPLTLKLSEVSTFIEHLGYELVIE